MSLPPRPPQPPQPPQHGLPPRSRPSRSRRAPVNSRVYEPFYAPEQLAERASKVQTWVIAKTPERVRERLPRRARVAAVIRGSLVVLAALYALLVCFGLSHAFTEEGRYHDRSDELRRAQTQLDEERARTEQLRSRVDALQRRDDVRIDAVRRELNMLREGERFYVFR